MEQYKLKFLLRRLLVQFIHENNMWKADTRNENKENTPGVVGRVYFTLNHWPKYKEENEYYPCTKVKG
jgi:hypothetical protein